jgi:hypothetical protein
MKFVELLNNTNWNDIEESLLKNYKNLISSINAYEDVYKHLLELNPIETKFEIYIAEKFNKDFDDEPYISVTGRDGSLNKESSDFKYMNQDEDSDFANSETNYSLSLTDWNEWLGMCFDNETIESYDKNEIIAHCLWEMTFYGFDQYTIVQNTKELNRRVEEVKNMTDEERKVKLISIEDIEKEL